MMARIKSDSTISNTTYHQRCRNEGQRNWWLRGPDGFIDIGEHRGDRDLDIEVDIPAGSYTLGAGPAGKFGVRQTLEVGTS